MNLNFYELLRARILTLPDLSASSRGLLYRRVIALANDYFSERPGEFNSKQHREVLSLIDTAIKQIEAEFAAAREAGIRVPEWAAPPKPPQLPPKSAPGPTAAPIEDNWDDFVESTAEQLQRTPHGLIHALRTQLRVTGALLAHYASTTSGTEPYAFLWLAVEPVLQVLLVISLYYAFGHTVIYSMPAIPFAIIGVCSWLMFRTCFTKIGTGLGREFVLCYLPGVSRFDVFLAKSIFYFLTYFISSTFMLWIMSVFDVARMEVRAPLAYFFYWVTIWLFSLSFSMIGSYALTIFPAIRRFLLVVLRVLYIFSGVAMVTEQLPAEGKIYFLWNPLLHGIQLMKSSYFYEYSSDDANVTYFLASLVFIIFAGLVAERAQYRFEVRA